MSSSTWSSQKLSSWSHSDIIHSNITVCKVLDMLIRHPTLDSIIILITKLIHYQRKLRTGSNIHFLFNFNLIMSHFFWRKHHECLRSWESTRRNPAQQQTWIQIHLVNNYCSKIRPQSYLRLLEATLLASEFIITMNNSSHLSAPMYSSGVLMQVPHSITLKILPHLQRHISQWHSQQKVRLW